MRETKTDPANDPPIHESVAGVNAGALPTLAAAREVSAGGGDGLLTIAKYGMRKRSELYRS